MSSFKPIISFMLFMSVSGFTHAQWSDYGLWSALSISQELNKKSEYSFDLMSRWDRDVTRLGTVFCSADFSRELSKEVEASVSGRLGFARTDEFQWEYLKRVSGSIRWKDDLLEDLSVSLRLKAQTGYKGTSMEGFPIVFSKALRLKPAVYYKLSKEFRLVFSGEFFLRPFENQYAWSDTRGRLSIRKKVAKRRYVTVGYQIQRPRMDADPWTEHTVICGFGIQKKRRNPKK